MPVDLTRRRRRAMSKNAFGKEGVRNQIPTGKDAFIFVC
jgi:hypothetical protein